MKRITDMNYATDEEGSSGNGHSSHFMAMMLKERRHNKFANQIVSLPHLLAHLSQMFQMTATPISAYSTFRYHIQYRFSYNETDSYRFSTDI